MVFGFVFATFYFFLIKDLADSAVLIVFNYQTPYKIIRYGS